ncbi:MAG: hypothetical protein IJC66_12670, partial [Kiritimatiellae bacterium]|nr:hypothetical protein [Kiritimatiellia bacterium]
IKGSALKALEAVQANSSIGRGQDKWVDKIWELMDAVDAWVPTPERVCFMDERFIVELWNCGILHLHFTFSIGVRPRRVACRVSNAKSREVDHETIHSSFTSS